MLRYAKWLAYRDKVLDHLGALLMMYPRGRQFTADFPGLRDEMQGHFEAGVSPAGAALQMAAAVIADILGQLSREQRRSALAQLESLGGAELQEMAAQQLSRRPPQLRDPAEFAASLIGVALFLARRMTEEGTLGRGELEFFLAEMEKALGPTQGPLAANDGRLRTILERWEGTNPLP